jgi:hypothetical protein
MNAMFEPLLNGKAGVEFHTAKCRVTYPLADSPT